jgi:hypothetical protein
VLRWDPNLGLLQGWGLGTWWRPCTMAAADLGKMGGPCTIGAGEVC